MNWESIWNRAQADLVLTTERGRVGPLLWEHSARVARSAQRIAELPAVQKASPDPGAVVAAALYHDAGWIVHVREGTITPDEILLRPASDILREQGALLLERSLRKLLPPDSLTRAARAIRTLNDRESDSIEGQVVAEADNLDEFGAAALWMSARRSVLEARGIEAVIDSWHRRKEYHYWEARLKDSFRFPAIRAVARRRLEQFERFMQELEIQHRTADLPLHTSLSSSGSVAEPSHH